MAKALLAERAAESHITTRVMPKRAASTRVSRSAATLEPGMKNNSNATRGRTGTSDAETPPRKSCSAAKRVHSNELAREREKRRVAEEMRKRLRMLLIFDANDWETFTRLPTLLSTSDAAASASRPISDASSTSSPPQLSTRCFLAHRPDELGREMVAVDYRDRWAVRSVLNRDGDFFCRDAGAVEGSVVRLSEAGQLGWRSVVIRFDNDAKEERFRIFRGLRNGKPAWKADFDGEQEDV